MSGKVHLKQLFQSDAITGGVIRYGTDNWTSFNSIRFFDEITGVGDGYDGYTVLVLFNMNQQAALAQIPALVGDGNNFLIQAQGTTQVGADGGDLVLSSGLSAAGGGEHGDVRFSVGHTDVTTEISVAAIGYDATVPEIFQEFAPHDNVWMGQEDSDSPGNGNLFEIEAQTSRDPATTGGELRLRGGESPSWGGPVTIYSGAVLAASINYFLADFDVRMDIDPGFIGAGTNALTVDCGLGDIDDCFSVDATYTRNAVILGDKLYGCYAATPGMYSTAGGDGPEVRAAAYTAKTPFNTNTASTLSAFYIVGDATGTNPYDYGLLCRDENLRIGTEARSVNDGPDIEIVADDGVTGTDGYGGSIILVAGQGDGTGEDGVVYIPGKLTVDGALDPISVIIQDKTLGTDAYLEIHDGSNVSAPGIGDTFGRMRYHDALSRFEVAYPGGPWQPIGGGGPAGDGYWNLNVDRLYPDYPKVVINNVDMYGGEVFRADGGVSIGGTLMFEHPVTAPQIIQDTHSGAGDGVAFEIHAQATNDVNGDGGDLELHGGTGGATTGTGGRVTIVGGGGAVGGSVLVGGADANTGGAVGIWGGNSAVATDGGEINIVTGTGNPVAGTVNVQIGTMPLLTMDWTGIQFDSDRSLVVIDQGDEVAGPAGHMRIAAQNSAAPAGGDGGSLFLFAGDGYDTNDGGSVILQSGAEGAGVGGWNGLISFKSGSVDIANIGSLTPTYDRGDFYFDIALTSGVLITQTDQIDANPGAPFEIHAQDGGPGSGGHGGDLILTSGIPGIGEPGEIIVNAGSNMFVTMDNTGAFGNVTFGETLSTVTITQEQDPSANGARFTIQAQRGFDNLDGGDLQLIGGTAGGAVTGDGGDVIVQAGAGAGSGANGVVQININTIDTATFDASATTGVLRFDPAFTSGVRLGQSAAPVSTAGAEFHVIAQDATGPGNHNGGELHIVSGRGAGTGSDGQIVLDAGDNEVYVPGKLTVDGYLDPIAVIIEDKGAGSGAYLQMYDGSVVSPPGGGDIFGRFRYNDGAGQFEVAYPGGAWQALATGAGGEWTRPLDVLEPTTGTVDTWEFGDSPSDPPIIRQADGTTGGADELTVHAQDMTGVTATGGLLTLRGGDSTNASGTNVGGDVFIRGGDAVPSAGTGGDITLHMGGGDTSGIIRIERFNGDDYYTFLADGDLRMDTDADFRPATTNQGQIGTPTYKFNNANLGVYVATGISGNTNAYLQNFDGSTASAVGGGDDFGRMRYNDSTNDWEVSTPTTGGWVTLTTGVGGEWTRAGDILEPTTTSVNIWRFDTTALTPIITQESSSSGTGEELYIRAQSMTGSNDTGGTLYLDGGSSTWFTGGETGGDVIVRGGVANAGAGTGGDVLLRQGLGGGTSGVVKVQSPGGGDLYTFEVNGSLTMEGNYTFAPATNKQGQVGTVAAKFNSANFSSYVATGESGDADAYLQNYDGYDVAAVGGGSDFGRLRYNDDSQDWEVSTPSTGGWIGLATGAGGEWTRTGDILEPTTASVNVWQFDVSALGPDIGQEATPNFSWLGEELTIHAQDAPAGGSTGGLLALRQTDGGSNDGDIEIQNSAGATLYVFRNDNNFIMNGNFDFIPVVGPMGEIGTNANQFLSGSFNSHVAFGNNPATSGAVRLSQGANNGISIQEQSSGVTIQALHMDGGDDLWIGEDSSLGIDDLYVATSSGHSIFLQIDSTNELSITDGQVILNDASEFIPANDGNGSVGTAANRFDLVRAVTVTSGDLAFDDRACPICGGEFQVDEELALKVIQVEDDTEGRRITKTVPMHQTCCKK